MEITVKDVSMVSAGGICRISFAEKLQLGSGRRAELTNVGTRALRIARHVAGASTSYNFVGSQGTVLEIGPCGMMPAELADTATAQKAMDKWANEPIKVAFGLPVVKTYAGGRWLKTMADVDEWRERRAGIVVVQQSLELSLPYTVRDLARVTALLPGLSFDVHPGEIYEPTLKFVLRGEEYMAMDPWKLMKDLEPRIRGAIQ